MNLYKANSELVTGQEKTRGLQGPSERILRCTHKNIISSSESARSGGKLPQEIWKSRVWEMPFPSISTNKCEGKCSIELFILPIFATYNKKEGLKQW